MSILNIDNGVMQVKSVRGHNHLGGEDFDNRLVEWCIKDYKLKSGDNISNEARVKRKLKT